MSEKNQPHVDLSFDVIQHLIKSAVPPCTAITDTPSHYEVVAVHGDHQHLFGAVIAHNEEVTVCFNTEIPENEFKQLVSEDLIRKMNPHRRLEVRNIKSPQLHEDLQNACNKMLYYFNEKGWVNN